MARPVRQIPRRRHLLGMSAVAVSALLTTYAAGLRQFTYARAVGVASLCSPGATEVADDTQLRAAVTASTDDSIICVTADITVSQTLVLDDTSLTLEGDDATVQLSGGGVRRVLYADFSDAADDTLTLRNLTLTAGTSLNADDSDGGAVLLVGNGLADTFVGEAITVTNSYAFEDGGGIALEQMDHVRLSGARFYDDSAGSDSGAFEINFARSVLIENSTFKRNTAVNDQGGAFEFQDVLDVRVYSSHFAENEAQSDGGSIQIFSGSDFVRLSNTQFLDDSSGDEGGSAALENITTLRIDNVTVGGGQSANRGGGLFLSDDTDVQITNSTFRDNTSLNSGGGIQVSSQRGPITLTDVRAYDNTSSTSSGGFLRLTSAVDMTVTRLTSRGNEADDDGGSIRQTAGTLTLSDSTFNDDSAGLDGGALSTSGLTAVNLTSVTVTGARAAFDGGALYSGDDTRVTITDSTFTSNIAGDDAGALEILRPGGVYLSDTAVRLNRAIDEGGGVRINDADDTVALSDVLLEGNQAGDRGGGLNVRDHLGLFSADRVSVLGNSSTNSSGGGMYLDVDGVNGEVHVRNSTIANNDALNVGGGVFLQLDVNAAASIVNSTITGNGTTSFGGGGLWINQGIAEIEFTTITGNSSASGGGLETDSSTVVSAANSIIAGNTAPTAADVLINTGSTLDDSFSLFTSAAAVAGATADGPGTIFGLPKLNGLADNGGPTSTMLPQWDSPAFQAGDPNWTAPPANDQRGAGFPRDAGGRVSMGAIQGRSAQPAPPPVFPPSAPRDVSAAAGEEQAVVSWTAPATSGSFPVTTYQVDDSTGDFTCLVTVAPGQPLACVIEDLTNGVPYSFRVRALNGAGWGAWSAFSDPVTPQPGASILISGSREGPLARVEGEAPGLEGKALVPRLRFPGPRPYTDGNSRPVVDSSGDFTWQRQANKRIYVYFVTEDGLVRSNRVIIPKRPLG